jgi:ATP-binding cassette subfamily F protein 3
MPLEEEAVQTALANVFAEKVDGLDDDLIAYLSGLLSEGLEDEVTTESVAELMEPFLESMACPPELMDQANQTIVALASAELSDANTSTRTGGAQRLKQGIVSMSSHLTDQSQTDVEANRYLWGTDTAAAMANTQIDSYSSKISQKDKRKQRQELEQARREFQAKLELEQQEENATQGVVSAMVLPDYRSGRNERDVQVRNVSISLDNGRSLLDDGELKFAHRRRYGLVGKNGVGKTTLLKAIAAMEIEGFPKHLRVLHVRQELKTNADDTAVLTAVLEADAERNALLEEEKSLLRDLEQEDGEKGVATSVQEKREKLLAKRSDDAKFEAKLKRLDEVYARLQVVGSDAAEARASTILSGLQFTPEMQAGPTSALSGGWRMRVALAAALFIEPDILMLDEPTNHLDLEAVLWLESYLVEYKHTLIVVSHDRGFLNEVCTDIIEFDKKKLTYYRGNYDSYVKARDEKIKNDMRVYHAYQDKRAHMMEFIEKFRANAKRATMVQSRIKAVEKMDAEAPEPIEVESVWRFSIPNPEPLGRPIISVDDVSFDYKPVLDDGTKKAQDAWLLQMVNFGVDLSSRIGILGANGCGKSTLLNLILGFLEPLKGSVSRNGRLRIGHFTQHSADKFDLQLSSVENMLNLFPNADDQEMRSFLGRFQIQGTEALKPMFLLSGGQKSRVAFASLSYQKPHVIIMDEPTNHLDMESIDALVEAIRSFQGGLMVVSHDQYFITNTCRELWVIGDGHATRFRGDFDEYKKHTLEKTRKRVEASVKRLSEINN